jgi:hypoxanthine phosphoribosyltransferase
MEQRAQVTVHGLDYLHRLTPQDRLLLVDDVHDTGQSINEVIKQLHDYFGTKAPEIRIAMPYFKPLHNLTGRIPDFFLHTTEAWLVFPHELQGLTDAEVMEKQGLQELAPRLLRLRDQMAQPNSVKESS